MTSMMERLAQVHYYKFINWKNIVTYIRFNLGGILFSWMDHQIKEVHYRGLRFSCHGYLFFKMISSTHVIWLIVFQVHNILLCWKNYYFVKRIWRYIIINYSYFMMTYSWNVDLMTCLQMYQYVANVLVTETFIRFIAKYFSKSMNEVGYFR